MNKTDSDTSFNERAKQALDREAETVSDAELNRLAQARISALEAIPAQRRGVFDKIFENLGRSFWGPVSACACVCLISILVFQSAFIAPQGLSLSDEDALAFELLMDPESEALIENEPDFYLWFEDSISDLKAES